MKSPQSRDLAEVLRGSILAIPPPDGERRRNAARPLALHKREIDFLSRELLARALAWAGRRGDATLLLEDLEALAHGNPTARQRLWRARALVEARSGGDGVPCIQEALSGVRETPRGEERADGALTVAMTAADYSAMEGSEPAAHLALEAVGLVPKTRGHGEELGRIVRKIALRTESEATTLPLLAIAEGASGRVAPRDQRVLTRAQLAVAAARLGRGEDARVKLGALARELEKKRDGVSMIRYPDVFRARAQAGFWDEAEPMMRGLEEAFQEGVGMIGAGLDVVLLSHRAGAAVPRDVRRSADASLQAGMGILEATVFALAAAAALGPPSAGGCLFRALELAESVPLDELRADCALWVAELASGHDGDVAEAAFRIAREAMGRDLERPTPALESYVQTCVRVCGKPGQSARLAEAGELLAGARLSSAKREDLAIEALYRLATLAEDRRGGVAFFHG